MPPPEPFLRQPPSPVHPLIEQVASSPSPSLGALRDISQRRIPQFARSTPRLAPPPSQSRRQRQIPRHRVTRRKHMRPLLRSCAPYLALAFRNEAHMSEASMDPCWLRFVGGMTDSRTTTRRCTEKEGDAQQREEEAERRGRWIV